jgi:hypothetical protein
MRALKLPVGQATKTDNYTRIWEDQYVIDTYTKDLVDDDLIDVVFNHLGHEKSTDFDFIIKKFWKSGKLSEDERYRLKCVMVLLYCDYYRT